MILFDFRSGITLSLLVKALAMTLPDGMDILQCHIFSMCHNNPSRHPLLQILEKDSLCTSIDEMLLSLNTDCSALPSLTAEQAVRIDAENKTEISALLDLVGVDSLDPFDFSTYISLTFLLRQHDIPPGLLAPRIGSESHEQVFSILENTGIHVNSTVPAISTLCAAVLSRYFTPFLEENPPGIFEKAVSWSDPLRLKNRVRAFFFRESPPESEHITVIQTNIDDMTPEMLAGAVQVMIGEGALDVTVTPVLMKKGRPGYQVEVLIPPTDQTRMEELLLQQTTTFGVRSYTCSRRVLDRKQEQFASSFGPVRIKRGYYQGKCVRTSLEYEDLAALSDKTGIPLISLYTDIQKEITGGSTGKTVRTRSPCD